MVLRPDHYRRLARSSGREGPSDFFPAYRHP